MPESDPGEREQARWRARKLKVFEHRLKTDHVTCGQECLIVDIQYTLVLRFNVHAKIA